MYILMNKNTKIALLDVKPQTAFRDEKTFEMIEQYGELPLGFRDTTSWVDGRNASKHNEHLRRIMTQMGCADSEGFILTTHAATINDTFWIKSEDESTTWEQVSLYRNQFSEVVSKLAFEGVGLYDDTFSPTSPELSSEGSFRKCFKKEDRKGEFSSDIFLYKRGGTLGKGLEPYCEVLASEIAKIISPQNSVSYELVMLHDKIASECNLFTDEKYGYAAFSKLFPEPKVDLQEVFDYFQNIGSEQSFREMLVIDSLCFNQDRHKGNYGVLFNNDTLQVEKASPIFDLNLSLLPYVEQEEFKTIGNKLYGYAPKLGTDFTRIGQMGMNDILRDRVKNIVDFSFSFRGDDVFPKERVEEIEKIVRRQAEAILSKEKLMTKNVFFSQVAVDEVVHYKKPAK